MISFNYDSLYARTAVRGKARELLVMPQTFALWGKKQMATTPGMATWSARQWLATFLQDMTNIPWLVSATSLDLAAMPRHDPLLRMELHEQTTADPPLPLPPWIVALTADDVSGAVMLQFIDATTHAVPYSDKTPFLPLTR